MPAKKQKAKDAPEKARSATLMMTVGELTLPLPRLVDLTFDERFVVRAETGIRAEDWFPNDPGKEMGEDTAAVWWWLARRRASGKKIPFAVAGAEIQALIDAGEAAAFSVDLGDDDDEADSPEG